MVTCAQLFTKPLFSGSFAYGYRSKGTAISTEGSLGPQLAELTGRASAISLSLHPSWREIAFYPSHSQSDKIRGNSRPKETEPEEV